MINAEEITNTELYKRFLNIEHEAKIMKLSDTRATISFIEHGSFKIRKHEKRYWVGIEVNDTITFIVKKVAKNDKEFKYVLHAVGLDNSIVPKEERKTREKQKVRPYPLLKIRNLNEGLHKFELLGIRNEREMTARINGECFCVPVPKNKKWKQPERYELITIRIKHYMSGELKLGTMENIL